MAYRAYPDDQLVSLLKTGDRAAFAEIYRRFWKRLYLSARQKVGDTAVVEELLQDIFTRLWENRSSLLITHLEAYLFSALKYAVINHIRFKLVRERHAEKVLLHQPAQGYSTEEYLALHDLVEALDEGLLTLPEKTRRIFQLNRLEYKSVREIAELLQMPQRTVEYHLTQAVRTLQRYLKDFLVLLLVLLSSQ